MVENCIENPKGPKNFQGAGLASFRVGDAAFFPGWLGPEAQAALVDDLRAVVAAAPLFSPITRFGKAMSVRMTSAGVCGWYSDRRGYRYERRHPSGRPWPPIPARVLDIWRDLVGPVRQPDCCLLNFYEGTARMGLHQDRDETDFSWPVLSISLGDDALFRIGGTERGGPTEPVRLRSGDVIVLAGQSRLAFHGIDRVYPGTSDLLPRGGRINLTLRVVD
ncbi:alpha-ketoglutarate-dependent dioxygenase AlkB family protein [Albidovulum sp.]|uniref:alpha-ketoglutarate-dependent dioxygenase AlkB family protein n=1 Tax=Albidovulum sp. TaxID=1872424 RepID=UPI001D66A649|nr:alpha-ketoglutarate-dependent dioxygenase AlkB [Paracoccaceae bacterium]MCC0045574.1 alpha-ketoglutarate-dependent dioxygenase AlkB [Defluviimonas sp.]MCP5355071.1 alpha-ketoglutarate-dependent dioxygenase AlkB [Paracoccaceae bacterium]HPE25541.1 alpha-ketoglutarate-dependent dioxygenase AlkB [Albidovulum sp.]HRV63706.1 alpha-ketoglutarate-dependent dioxygenase AlkB [Albidovulum sp.]